MKKILLPTDFSDNAWNAIEYALEFFKNENCFFYILHTYTPVFYRVDYMIWGPTYSAIPDSSAENALIALEKTVTRAKLLFNNPKHSFGSTSAFNVLTDEVRDISRKKEIDIIVMGTQGATGAKEIFLGTNSVHIIRKSKIPVMVIPNGYKFKEIDSIVFPTDYRSLYKKEELQVLLDLVKAHQAKLTILHVKAEYDLTQEQQLSKELLLQYFNDMQHVFKEQKAALMPEAVLDFVDEHDSGLLVMMNRKHSFLERWLFKQSVDSIGFHTTVPLLVMPDTSEIKY